MWDARNRLFAVSRAGVSASFVYDALGRRISRTINGKTTDYQYDGNDIVSELGGSSIEVTYLRGLDIDEVFVRKGMIEEYYHADALKSSMGLTDSSGLRDTYYEYEAFGEVGSIGASSNSYKYTGREIEGTGLYYYRARYYSPELKRFISEDPLRVASLALLKQNPALNQFLTVWIDTLYEFYLNTPQHFNAYVYALQNPLKYSDPFGLEADVTRGTGSFALGSALLGAGLAHGAAASGLFASLGAASALTPEILALAEPIHILAAAGITASVGVVLAGAGGFLIGQGINHFVPYLGEGELGRDIYDWFHPEPPWSFPPPGKIDGRK